MPAIHIRDVPESTLAALRERAERHGRSMQQELRAILEAAAQEPPPPSDTPPPLELITTKTSAAGTWSREETYGEEGR
jgi:plasmid stability protein